MEGPYQWSCFETKCIDVECNSFSQLLILRYPAWVLLCQEFDRRLTNSTHGEVVQGGKACVCGYCK